VRIGGLASGMDIDSIVSEMMKAKRIPLDKLKQEKQTLEWKRDEYRAMNTMLLDFRLELTQYKLTSKYRARVANSSDESKLTATATGVASNASYTIKNVTDLASAANKVSGTISNDTQPVATKIDPTKSLLSQNSNFSDSLEWSKGVIEKQSKKLEADTTTYNIDLAGATLMEPGNMNVKVNGKSLEVVTKMPTEPTKLGADQVYVDSTGKLTFGATVRKDSSVQIDFIVDSKTESISTINPVKDVKLAKGSIDTLTLTVNGTDYLAGNNDENGNAELKSAAGTVIGTINKETGKITFAAEQAKGSTISATYKQNYSTFSIATYNESGKKDVNFLITGDQSLNTVFNMVNDSDAGVSMFYDSFSDQATMTRTKTGNFNTTGNEIDISGGFLEDLLKFGGTSETGGTNVKFEINGLATERYSNTFEMNGVTFSIKDKIGETGVTTAITNNTNDVFENIKSFVGKYNELIGKIQAKTSEEYYRSYDPLTDEQKETLTDKQQEQWEEKAKSGLLKRDQTLNSLLSNLRTDFYSPVDNANVSPLFSQLASIGITTTSNYLEGGKLEINEDKLKKAIEADPNSVENLFRGGTDATTDSQKGIIHRLYESVDKTYNELKAKAGGLNSVATTFTLGLSLKNMDSQITRFEDKLKTFEDRYWRQFTAMETAIHKANSQSTYISGMFANNS